MNNELNHRINCLRTSIQEYAARTKSLERALKDVKELTHADGLNYAHTGKNKESTVLMNYKGCQIEMPAKSVQQALEAKLKIINEAHEADLDKFDKIKNILGIAIDFDDI